MAEQNGEIIVGVLGQWASGKTTASSTLLQHLGGEDKVHFINDRAILAGQAIQHILNLEEDKIEHLIKEDGSQEFRSDLVTVFLPPGEDFSSVDLNMLLFDLHSGVYDNVSRSLGLFDKTRLEVGYQIQENLGGGKPIVIEVGFGTNTDPKGENPFHHSLPDFFEKLEEAGMDVCRVKWIIIEVGYETRARRNRQRPDMVPEAEFAQYAADGGDLDPAEQAAWEARGIVLRRVDNGHDDKNKFKADIIAAFEDMHVGSVSSRDN
jgi:hypothetical protein